MTSDKQLEDAEDEFVTQWGVMGSAWGVTRTMAQIHALLMIADQPQNTDAIMEKLGISRGNAHGNLKDLVNWGIVRSVIVKGERKEHFEAEKDPWKIFCIVARERRRREIEPLLSVLRDCRERTKGLRDNRSKAFTQQLKKLEDFVEMSDGVLARVGRSEESTVVKWMMQMLR